MFTISGVRTNLYLSRYPATTGRLGPESDGCHPCHGTQVRTPCRRGSSSRSRSSGYGRQGFRVSAHAAFRHLAGDGMKGRNNAVGGRRNAPAKRSRMRRSRPAISSRNARRQKQRHWGGGPSACSATELAAAPLETLSLRAGSFQCHPRSPDLPGFCLGDRVVSMGDRANRDASVIARLHAARHRRFREPGAGARAYGNSGFRARGAGQTGSGKKRGRVRAAVDDVANPASVDVHERATSTLREAKLVPAIGSTCWWLLADRVGRRRRSRSP